jgi:glycosyltransferase involved in cell wall biosynthesis
LTTCAVDYITWKNHYQEGVEPCGETTIRRFVVSIERKIEDFNALSAQLLNRQRLCSMDEQQEWMRAQGPLSPGLSDYIREYREHYDIFIFFGYLYATTFDNLPLVAEKAWLVPCAHDEWPINFTMFDRLFALPQGIIFNTFSEREFAQNRFAQLKLEGPVAGVGIEPPADVQPLRFREKYNLNGPFLLYCGRIDPSKGCDEMFKAFLDWKRDRPLSHKLVLIGKAVMTIPDHPDIISLGFVPEEDKWDAMAACDWLIMPSIYESLSMVLLEAWSVGRPALVNARCAVLADHCASSRGGIAFKEWAEARAAIEICTPTEASLLGKNGQRYVLDYYSWDQISIQYQSLLSVNAASRQGINARVKLTHRLWEGALEDEFENRI